MSITSEISRISGNIAAAYDACEGKGATLPQTQSSANLADTIGGIPTQTDQSKITYNITPSSAAQFITAARAAYAGSASTIVGQYLESGSLPVSKSESVSGNVQLTYFDGKTVNESASGTYTIRNVSPNGARLSVVGGDDSTSVSKAVKPTGTVRFIDSLSKNARDLGGWPCDGGTVKYGLLYRTGFFSVSDAAYQNKSVYIDRLGVLHEFDLRGSGAAGSPYFPVGHYHSYTGSVQFHQVVTGSGSYDTLLKDLLTDVMTAAIHKEPAVFHCSQGCDRTGTLAFYLECILGLSDVDLDIDFELSSLCDDGNASATTYYRTRTDSGWTALKNKFSSYTGANLSAKVISYLFSIGISADIMNAFRAAMCDGTPAALTAPSVSVTGNYTNCSASDQSQSVAVYQPYSAVITPDSGYTLDGASVSITMNGTDITSTVYSAGTISIASVTGALVISVTAVPSVTQNLFDVSQAEVNTRMSSNGATAAYGTTQLTTGYIAVTGTDVIQLTSDLTQDTNNYTGMISVFDSSKAHLKQAGKANGNWTWNGDKTAGSFNISGLSAAGVTVANIRYCRICIAYTDAANISVTK